MQSIIDTKIFVKDKDLIMISRKEYEVFSYFSKIIDQDQLWFWSKEWQEKEKEAEDDIKSGNISGSYKTKDELQTALNKLK